MTESDTRAVLLMRACEPNLALGWAAHDAGWAGREARHRLGEQASPEAWLIERARLGLARLAERNPALGGLLALGTAASGAPRLLVAGLLLLAALLGILVDGLDGGQFVNLLAPPLLALLAWNLVVCLLLLAAAVRRWASPSGARPGLAAVASGPLRRWLLARVAASRAWLLARWLRKAMPASDGLAGAMAQTLAQFTADWWRSTAPLQAARLAALLHAMAALLALGALASLYARGLVLDYRAGWDSTFLEPAAVQRLLGWVLGPAAAVNGQALPDAGALAGLRRATGGGEGAARWIHLWALTLLAAVVLPRGLLAAAAALRARALAADLPLGPGHDDLHRLLRSASGMPLRVSVLPYSYALDAGRRAALASWLDHHLGPGVQAQVHSSLALGAEDDPARWWPAPMPETVVVLFALTATPEAETHGVLLRLLVTALPAPDRLRVMVDESGFRQRLAGRDTATRLAQRRAAWSALLLAQGLAPWFIDLSAPPGGAPTPHTA